MYLPFECKFRSVENGRLGQIYGRIHTWPDSSHWLSVIILTVVTNITFCRRTATGRDGDK